jgi:hypothetical protein
MKKFIALLMALVMVLSLVACGSDAPDKQPAIDSFNAAIEVYNEFVEVANADIDSLSDEEIEYFNAISAYLEEQGALLGSDEALSQEQIDEMVEMFDEFAGVMQEIMAEIQG